MPVAVPQRTPCHQTIAAPATQVSHKKSVHIVVRKRHGREWQHAVVRVHPSAIGEDEVVIMASRAAGAERRDEQERLTVEHPFAEARLRHPTKAPLEVHLAASAKNNDPCPGRIGIRVAYGNRFERAPARTQGPTLHDCLARREGRRADRGLASGKGGDEDQRRHSWRLRRVMIGGNARQGGLRAQAFGRRRPLIGGSCRRHTFPTTPDVSHRRRG